MSISLYMWLLPTLLALLLLLVTSHADWAWKRRHILAEAAIGMQLSGLFFLMTTPLDGVLQAISFLCQGWAILLAVRLLFGRLPEGFLRNSTHLNSVLTLAISVIVFDVWLIARLSGTPALSVRKVLTIVLLFSIAVAFGLLYQIFWTLKHYKTRNVIRRRKPKDWPTVTLAIPARNETHALSACLEAAVASTYPKLEILVLDDCSQDRSSEIIRSYAKDGVRFVQGDAPAEGWLGRNQALETLAEHATGDIIVFAGVDTQLSRQSITELVSYAVSNNLEMVTVLPSRRDGLSIATLLAPLRYYWQIAFPLTARRVPVATQCLLIKRSSLEELGGMAAAKHKIVPEAYFARALFTQDKYRFILSNATVGVTTAKRWSSQLESSLRFLYPTFKRQPLLILIASLLYMALLLLPFVVLVCSLIWGNDVRLMILSAIACGLLWLDYLLVVIRTHPRTWLLTLIFFPISMLQELILMTVSMLLYEFGEVNWKGRNVCYPVISQTEQK